MRSEHHTIVLVLRMQVVATTHQEKSLSKYSNRKKKKKKNYKLLDHYFKSVLSVFLLLIFSAPGRCFGGKDYLPAVLLCNSLCKQFCWNKLTLRCSLTLPAAWEMITECYEAKQPPAMLRRGNFMTSCFYGGFVSVCVCVSEPRESSATAACACGQEGRKPPRTKGIHIQVLNGLCDCHHHSLILLCEGIKMIQG